MKVSAMPKGIWGAVVVLSGILSGCAVLTIDVDVYKGSLINEERVQLHQLLALATAAKPMLVQVRDSNEWPHYEKPPGSATWYKPSYVRPPQPQVFSPGKFNCMLLFICIFEENTDYKFFKNSLAMRANEVLCLYEDSCSPGRRAKGLDHMTGEYLNNRKNQSLDGAAESENELIDALVEFSSNVLFLANHEGLISPPRTKGLFISGAENIGRSLFGDDLIDNSFTTRSLYGGTPNVPEAKHLQYVRVLQAVGNSILFSVNELRERTKHHEGSGIKVTAEVASVNLSRSPDPKKVLGDLLKELQQERGNAEKKLVEATAQQVAITAKVGSSTPPLTGLRADEKMARDLLDAARQTLATYQGNNKKVKAIYGVLTEEVVTNIKTQWASAGKMDVSSLSAFLNGPDGIAGKIANALTVKQGTSTSEEIQRFKDAEGYLKDSDTERSFQAKREQDGYTSMKLVDLLDNFVEHIHRLEGDPKSRNDQEATYVQTQDQKDQELKRIENDIERLQGELQQVKILVTNLPTEIAAVETARAVIDGVKPDVLQDIERHSQFISPSAVYLLIATHLSKAEAAKSNATDKKPFQETQSILSKRTPPAGGPLLDPKNYKSPQAVMDEVIALLRHRQLEAVERSGAGSEQDKKTTQALERAYQHRAGMLYIRPSSAYLRTSFPSTSLQDDPNLAWDNMLLHQGIRNLPFSSQLREILNPSVRQDRLLTAELDKQYWQNINRVRVSGTGFTNQVVAKDDVGNWYVKQYYGDTEDFIKSAKNLALFNLGMKLPIDLAGELKKAAKPADKPESETRADAPPLNRVLEKHRKAYQTKTTEASTKLQAMHKKDGENTIYNQIVTAWREISEIKSDTDSMDALQAALDDEIREWDKAAEALKGTSDQDQGQLIAKDLRALSRLDKSLSVKIQEIDKKGSKPREKLESLEKALAPKKDIDDETKRLSEFKAKATAEMRRLVGPLVLDILKDRKQTLDSYEQAIIFIGDASNPTESPQKQSN